MWSADVLCPSWTLSILTILTVLSFGCSLMYFHIDRASFFVYTLFRIAVYAVQHLLNFWSFTGALYVPLCVHLFILCYYVYVSS